MTTTPQPAVPAGPTARRWLRRGCILAVVVVLLFAVRRVLVDFPSLGAPPPRAAEDDQYARHTLLAYVHIVPATIYLLGGALQLNARFRRRHPVWHRRSGRVVVGCGLIAGVFAIVFGVLWPFGGVSEAITTVIFGAWFEFALVRAFAAARARRFADHRRWMIRAYATGTAVGTIRILVGILVAPVGFQPSFAIAFPVAFVIHTIAAEWYLRGAVRRAPGAVADPVAG